MTEGIKELAYLLVHILLVVDAGKMLFCCC